MRHNKGLKKLNRTSSHRKAMMMNMAVSLFEHEQIKTTLPKAKVLRPFAEKLVTLARNKNLHAERRLFSILRDGSSVRKLVDDIAVRSADRPGGYTRIFKFGFRYGDVAPMAIIELVDKQSKTLAQKTSVSKSPASKKTAEKQETDLS